MEKNLPRWKTTPFYQPEHEMKIFKQDITQPIVSPLIKGVLNKREAGDLLIVTE
jgi:hypothetical protein